MHSREVPFEKGGGFFLAVQLTRLRWPHFFYQTPVILMGKGWSLEPSISADSRYVAFSSLANNMVADDTNGVTDIFVHGRQTAETTRVSVNAGTTQGNDESDTSAISADGHYVAFASLASNLSTNDSNAVPDVFVRGPLVGFPWEMYLPAIISNKP